MNYDLGDLSNPSVELQTLNSGGVSDQISSDMLKMMLNIRAAEYKIADGRREGKIGGPVHLGIGQEAIAVGVSAHLGSHDRVFGAHRSHAHLLALGSNLQHLFAEILGKVTGCSRGMGGSMHLIDESVGFFGSVPIVAGTVPLAVGAALSLKLRGSNGIAVAYLGDGAIEEGVVQESLNFASLHSLPILFVVENNLFASHMNIMDRQPYNSTARFAHANRVPSSVIDGNDIYQVYKTAQLYIDSCRNGGGPKFIEAVTYRWLGHVDWREDIDVGVNRSSNEINLWKKRDPINRLVSKLLSDHVITKDQLMVTKHNIDHIVAAAWQNALNDPFPEPAQLLNCVYVG